MNCKPLSPSIAYGCIELLGIVSRNTITPNSVLSISVGAVNANDVLAVALYVRWVEISEGGLLQVATKGAVVLTNSDVRLQLQILLLDYIDAASPPWIQLALAGRRDVLSQSPKGICQVFVDAGLAYGNEPEIVSFWDLLAARARGIRSANLMNIGRDGERLTLIHEFKRVGKEAKWIALDSNTDGYDVLSQVSIDDKRRLTIEVKASTQANVGCFYITRNEWQVAEESRFHVFHLWDLSGTSPRLAVLNTQQMQQHIPQNTGDGIWETAKIPFEVFSSCFDNSGE